MALIKLTETNGNSLYISENSFGFGLTNSAGLTKISFFRNGQKSVQVQESSLDISEKSERFILLDGGTLVLDLDKVSDVTPDGTGSIISYEYGGKFFKVSDSLEALFSESTSVGFRETKEITADYTLQLEDYNKTIIANSSSAIEITVPNNMSIPFPSDAEVEILRFGSGGCTLVAANGININGANQNTTIDNQYDSITIKKKAANSWIITKRTCCSPTTPAVSALGNALRFTEADTTYVNFASDITTIDNHSMSLWFNLLFGNTVNVLIGRNDGTAASYINAIRGNNEIQVGAGWTTRFWSTGGINLSDRNWHHLVVTRDGTDYALYLDGQALSPTTNSTMPALDNINRFGFYNGTRLDGWMNQIAVWSGVLTPQEVSSLYNNGNGEDPTTVKASPIHLWEFNVDSNGDEQVGNTLFDTGSAALNGSLVNFTLPDDWVEHASVQNPPVAP